MVLLCLYALYHPYAFISVPNSDLTSNVISLIIFTSTLPSSSQSFSPLSSALKLISTSFIAARPSFRKPTLLNPSPTASPIQSHSNYKIYLSFVRRATMSPLDVYCSFWSFHYHRVSTVFLKKKAPSHWKFFLCYSAPSNLFTSQTRNSSSPLLILQPHLVYHPLLPTAITASGITPFTPLSQTNNLIIN